MNSEPNLKEMDKLNFNQPFVFDRERSCLLYADDLMLFRKMAACLQKLITATENIAYYMLKNQQEYLP